MKFLYFAFGCLVIQMACGKDLALQKHLTSTKVEFDQGKETIAFYGELLKENSQVKRQFEELLRKSSSYGDPHFGPDDPQVVEWIPRTERGGIEEGYSTDQHVLVVQSVSFTRPRQHDSDLVIVSEFHVTHVSKCHPVSGDEGPSGLDSDELTITFLGFRNLNLIPVGGAGKTE